jgi:hypothetical protein
MTNDFYEDIYSTLQEFADNQSTIEFHEDQVTPLNNCNEDVNNNDINYYKSLSYFDSISQEYLSDNQTNEISINRKEWLIIDSTSGKPRAPRQHEFLLLLLAKPEYSSYISWTDKDQGLCKIHEPKQVTRIWEKVKGRQTNGVMNYETFSRGIRFYYKSGLMIKTHQKHILRFKLPLNIIS